MKKIVLISVLIVAVLVGLFYAFNTYIYHEEQADLSVYTLGTYGYRCQDGTEFTMSLSEGMDTLHIVPATSVEKIPETILSKVSATQGVRYEADGITFAAVGETVTLGTEAFSTVCSPQQIPDEAPFNFGD